MMPRLHPVDRFRPVTLTLALTFRSILWVGCLNYQEFHGPSPSMNGVDVDDDYITNSAVAVTKISPRIIQRSIQPVRYGLFFGCPKSKTFRRECDRVC
mmetsp:Transcript_50274/g.50627  ORF Transcript_50274/g.50627 Transcript_50274/m.50627 type:complete len:98 (+) Transcript_50274:197-490(+)